MFPFTVVVRLVRSVCNATTFVSAVVTLVAIPDISVALAVIFPVFVFTLVSRVVTSRVIASMSFV